MKRHNQRCKECKVRIEELLIQIYGEVKPNHNLKIPAKSEDYTESIYSKDLDAIHKALQEHQGYKNFVRAKNYIAPVDFYVPEPGLIVEFDESQHFTALRKKALSLYPKDLKLGFDRDRWQDLCSIENQHDNHILPRLLVRRDINLLSPYLVPTVPNQVAMVVVVLWCSLFHYYR